MPRIAFTGSVPTGKLVAGACARHVKRVSLELGGKNPMIVFDDSDPRQAAAGAVAAMNLARSMGQSCGSSSRVFVHSRIKDAFCAALVEGVAELRAGDPRDPATNMGPLAFRAHYEKVTELIASGVSEGARLLYGGRRPSGLDRGYYLEPTVFTDVADDMRIAREEIFGPVMSVFEWSDYDEVIRRANATEYGLTANIWTNNISVAFRTARRLQAGYVYINGTGERPAGSPFGGVKSSGLGKENSLEELLSYTSEKSITATLF